MSGASTEAHAIRLLQILQSYQAAELHQKTHPAQSARHRRHQGLHSEQVALQQAGRLQEEALQHTGNRQQDQLRVLRNHPVLLTTEAPQEVQATLQVLAAAITEVHPEEVTAEEVIAEAAAVAEVAVMAGAATAEAVRAAEDKHTKIISYEKDSNYNPYGIGSGKRLCTDSIQRVDA